MINIAEDFLVECGEKADSLFTITFGLERLTPSERSVILNTWTMSKVNHMFLPLFLLIASGSKSNRHEDALHESYLVIITSSNFHLRCENLGRSSL